LGGGGTRALAPGSGKSSTPAIPDTPQSPNKGGKKKKNCFPFPGARTSETNSPGKKISGGIPGQVGARADVPGVGGGPGGPHVRFHSPSFHPTLLRENFSGGGVPPFPEKKNNRMAPDLSRGFLISLFRGGAPGGGGRRTEQETKKKKRLSVFGRGSGGRERYPKNPLAGRGGSFWDRIFPVAYFGPSRGKRATRGGWGGTGGRGGGKKTGARPKNGGQPGGRSFTSAFRGAPQGTQKNSRNFTGWPAFRLPHWAGKHTAAFRAWGLGEGGLGPSLPALFPGGGGRKARDGAGANPGAGKKGGEGFVFEPPEAPTGGPLLGGQFLGGPAREVHQTVQKTRAGWQVPSGPPQSWSPKKGGAPVVGGGGGGGGRGPE